jgi:hypothetical protein
MARTETESSKRHPKPKTITIEVNNKPVEMPNRDATGAEIKHAAGVPLDFTLYLKRGHELDEIGNDDTVKLHEREQFVAVSGQDVS